MKEEKKVFRIVVIEDSEFFNSVLTRQLQNYADALALERNCKFEIRSFTSPADCIRNMNEETDVAFVDFYLGNGITAVEMLEKIKRKCKNCKVIVISQVRSMKTSIMTITKGALDFIFKDVNALARACFIVEELVNERLSFKNN